MPSDMTSEFGPTVRRLQANVQAVQQQTDTFEQAAGELRQKRDSLQRGVDEADRQLSQRRAALAQFQFRLNSQRLLVDDCEKRATEAEQENAAVQAEVSRLRESIADERRGRLERLDDADGRVQGLVRQFHQAASLADTLHQQPDPVETIHGRVTELRQSVNQLSDQLETEQQTHLIPPEVKETTLRDAKASVEGLKRQLGV